MQFALQRTYLKKKKTRKTLGEWPELLKCSIATCRCACRKVLVAVDCRTEKKNVAKNCLPKLPLHHTYFWRTSEHPFGSQHLLWLFLQSFYWNIQYTLLLTDPKSYVYCTKNYSLIWIGQSVETPVVLRSGTNWGRENGDILTTATVVPFNSKVTCALGLLM